MKAIFFVLAFAISQLAYSQSPQPELKALLDSVIHRAQEVSYYTESVDWEALTAEVQAQSKDAKSLDELKPAFETLINGLRDHHGRVFKMPDHSVLAHFTDWEHVRSSDSRPRDQATWAIVNDPEARFEDALLPGNIGYLKVVGVGPNVDGQKEAERIRWNLLGMAKKAKVKKWVLDLRYNGGGNVNVMLAGLAPLLDAETVASVRAHDGQTQCLAEVQKDNFFYCGQNAFPINYQTRIKSPQIAVLTSRYTVSSGELTAIAFKGQERVRFFGEATGGYTTNTGYEVFNDQIALVIGTGVFCDRAGNPYPDNVPVDVEVPFEVEADKEKDRCIQEAVQWLGKKSK